MKVGGKKKESSKKTQQNSHYGIQDLQKKLMATEKISE
jgi:hypothetical protein